MRRLLVRRNLHPGDADTEPADPLADGEGSGVGGSTTLGSFRGFWIPAVWGRVMRAGVNTRVTETDPTASKPVFPTTPERSPRDRASVPRVCAVAAGPTRGGRSPTASDGREPPAPWQIGTT